MNTVAVEVDILGPLVAYALNEIDSEYGCCTTCCAPCFALAELIRRRQLDPILAVYLERTGGGWEWWNGERVSRTWLEHAWRRTDCHAPLRYRSGE